PGSSCWARSRTLRSSVELDALQRREQQTAVQLPPSRDRLMHVAECLELLAKLRAQHLLGGTERVFPIASERGVELERQLTAALPLDGGKVVPFAGILVVVEELIGPDSRTHDQLPAPVAQRKLDAVAVRGFGDRARPAVVAVTTLEQRKQALAIRRRRC